MKQKYFFTIIYTLLFFCAFSQITPPTGPPGPIEPVDPPTGPPGVFERSPVGKTEGNLEVTLTGAAVYDVPIKVPQGVNGVEPKISLQYNSQSGNGIAGIGWGISGGSSITRIPSTLYHDGKVSAVDFSKDDRFALDGQRLLLKSGTYGGDGAEYQTESYSNIKITSHGVSPYGAAYGPKYFKVSYPDGSTAMYGNTDNSRSRMEFAINRWENSSGIDIVYSYEEKGGMLLLSSIKYVSKIRDYLPVPNDSLVVASMIEIPQFQAYDNEVKFYYSDWNARKEEYYVGGIKFENTNHLYSIEVKSGGNLFRKYELELKRDALGYNFLTGIKEYNGVDEDGLPTVKLTYYHGPFIKGDLTTYFSDDRGTAFNDTIPTNLNGDVTGDNFAAMTGEFDGDGALDYIIYNKNKREYWLYYSTASEEGQFVHKNLGSTAFSEIFPIQLKDNNGVILPREGWVEITNSKFSVRSFANGTIKDEFTRTYDFPKLKIEINTKNCKYINDYSIPKLYLEGDFNGDGLTDILAVEKSFYVPMPECYSNIGYDEDKPDFGFLEESMYPSGKTFLIDLNNANTQVNVDSGIINYQLGSKIITGNFLGSNKTDLLVIDGGEMSVYSYNGTSFSKVFNYSNANIKLSAQMHLGDFNGDGKTDIMLSSKDYGTHIFYSTGKSFEAVEISERFYNDVSKSIYHQYAIMDYTNYVAVDFNNDGKTDILKFNYWLRDKDYGYYTKSGVVSSVTFLKNMGYGFQQVVDCKNPTLEFIEINSNNDNIQFNPIPIYLGPQRQIAYTNNYYRMGLFVNQKMYTFEYRYNHAVNRLLTNITNGDDISYKIRYREYGVPYKTYDFSPNDFDFEPYMKYSNETLQYPYIETTTMPNTRIAAYVELRNGTQKVLKKSFSYASSVFDLQGLGFLGFKGVVSTNWYDKTENMYKNIKEFDITKRGALKKESVISGNQWDSFIPSASGGGGIPIAKSYESITNYEYNSQQLANKVFKLQNTKITHTDYAGRAFSESFVKEVTNVFNNYNDITKQTVQYKYNSGLAVIVGSSNLRLDKTEITENTYGYNPSASNYYMSRLTKTKKTQTALNEASFVSEDTFTYDDKGRVTEIKKKGNNTAAITEKNTYDINGNITEKSVSAGSLAPRVMKYKYGYQGRFMTEQTDIDGLKTKYTYNSAKGLLTGETNPYGQTTQYGYNNWGQQTSVTDYLGKVTKTSYIKNGKTVEITTTNDEDAWSKEYFDAWGNKTKASVKNIAGDLVHKNFEYDVYNRVVKESENYLGNTPLLWTTTAYDKKGRIKKVMDSKGKEITTTYSLTKTTVNDGTTTKEVVVNAAGEVVSRKDAGGTINYKYFSNGNMKSADYGGVVIAVEQDGWGRKTKLTDPSAGVYTYEYNALGELVKETTPKGSTQFTLDDTGKITKKKITNDQTNSEINYTYDATTQLLTQSQAVIGGQNHTYDYSYDSHKRLNKTVETTPLAAFTKEVTYDEYGRTAQETFKATAYGKTSEKKVKNSYKNGYHWQVADAVTNAVLTSKESTNEYGLLTKVKLGNQLEINNAYDSYGYLKTNTVKKNTTELFKLTNVFDVQRGNLTSRTNGLFNRNETFDYDELDRLTSFTNKAGIQETQVYDNRGRIESNSVGDYDYMGTASYQLESIDLNAEAQAYYQLRPEQQVLYNAFKSPVWIKEQGKENIYFDYNANNQRSVMYYGNEAADKAQSSFRKHYSADGAMEITYNTATGKADFVTYIDGDAYSATVIAKGETAQEYFYLHRDYLGSILAITNAGGTIVEKRHFDAWGNLVFVKDGQNNDLAKLTFLDRGYTGHEHLQGVALIHMNGRLYDPVVKRFLAPDNFVQDPTNTQNFNRYGYVLNNPLVYVDPSGELFLVDDIIGAVVGGVVNLTMNIIQGNINGNVWEVIGKGAAAFGSGAVAGALATYGPAGWAAGGALVSVTNAWLGGANTTMDYFGAAVMGGLSGAMGGYVGQAITPGMNMLVGQMNIQSPVLNGIIGGGLGGGATSFAFGTAFALVQGKSFDEALTVGSEGAVLGFASGAVAGGASSYRTAKSQGIDPFSGKNIKQTVLEKDPLRLLELEINAAKEGTKLFGKEVVATTTRMGRDGKAVEVIFKDGSKIDINVARVKQWTPNSHPNAPEGTLQKVKFENSLPGSKGYKRTPTQSELDFLNRL